MLPHASFWTVWLAQVLFCYSAILIAMRLFGKLGVMVFMSVAVIAANIQVSRLVLVPGFHSPITLGTAIMASTYFASDLLSEYYDKTVARRAVLVSIFAIVVMLILFKFTLAFPPLSENVAKHFGVHHAIVVQNAMKTVLPAVGALFFVSLLSYFITQHVDIALYVFIKKLTKGRWLWLRNNVSTWLAALLDNAIFNILAWRVFTSHPVPWKTVMLSYVFGTYGIRVLCSVLDTPFMYLGKYVHRTKV